MWNPHTGAAIFTLTKRWSHQVWLRASREDNYNSQILGKINDFLRNDHLYSRILETNNSYSRAKFRNFQKFRKLMKYINVWQYLHKSLFLVVTTN